METLPNDLPDDSPEVERLRAEFARMPKTRHGTELQETHPEVLPEWVMRTIEQPYDQWEGYVARRNEVRTVLVGRVSEFDQWIKVVLVGRPGTGALHAACPDRQLEKRYGGRPWSNLA